MADHAGTFAFECTEEANVIFTHTEKDGTISREAIIPKGVGVYLLIETLIKVLDALSPMMQDLRPPLMVNKITGEKRRLDEIDRP